MSIPSPSSPSKNDATTNEPAAPPASTTTLPRAPTRLFRPSSSQNSPDMVVLKTSLALPSLSKSTSSRSNSPAPSPVPSEQGQKRTTSVTGGLMKARSKSGEGNHRTASVNSVNGNGTSTPTYTGALSPAPSSNGTSSLRPKLSSLLSGKATPHGPLSPALGGPGSSPAGGIGHYSSSGSTHYHSSTPNAAATPSAGGSHAPTPQLSTGAGGIAIAGLEASYVTKVGMSLNDAVNKVFPSAAAVSGAAAGTHGAALNDAALISYKGTCAPRVERARDVGAMIAHELHLAVNDQYLLRSLLRSAVLKTLSIFMSRLESLAISPVSEPSVLYVPKSVKEAENPPQSQRFSFMILRSAWEIRKGLVRACTVPASTDGTPIVEMPRFVKDTLTPWTTKLDLLAGKIWNPILAAIKDEVVRTITVQGALEVGIVQSVVTNGAVAAVSTAAQPLPHTHNARTLYMSRSSTPTPGSSATLAGGALAVPVYLKDLSSLLAATSRTFAWLSVAELDHQNWKVAIGSSVIWKMMMLCSSRRIDEGLPALAGAGAALHRRASPPPAPLGALTSAAATNGGTTAGLSAAAGVMPRRSMSAIGMGRLRGAASNSGKRSPSPPRDLRVVTLAANAAKLVAEAEIFETCLSQFVASLSLHAPASAHGSSEEGNPNSKACSAGKDCNICRGRFIPLEEDESDDEDALPREAMQEAMTALSSFIVVLRFLSLEAGNPVPKLLRAIAAVDDISLAPEICPNFIRALDLLPPLILLQTLVSRIPAQYEFRLPHQLWQTTWRDYESTMKGFNTGEEWVGEVGWELLKEARRVGKRLAAEREKEDGAFHSEEDVEGWLELVHQAVVELGEVDDLDEAGYGSTSNISLRSGNLPSGAITAPASN